MYANDIMLTGLPRSGTTLVCHLLNKLPDTVALAEPMKVGRFAKLPTRRAILDAIVGFAAQQRESLLTRGMAFSKHHEGSVPDNFYEAARGADGLRRTHEVRDSNRAVAEEAEARVLGISVVQSLHQIDDRHSGSFPNRFWNRSPSRPSDEERISPRDRPAPGDLFFAAPPRVGLIPEGAFREEDSRPEIPGSFDVVEVVPDLQVAARKPSKAPVEKDGLRFGFVHGALASWGRPGRP